MTPFEVLLIPTIFVVAILAHLSVKNHWKIAEFF